MAFYEAEVEVQDEDLEDVASELGESQHREVKPRVRVDEAFPESVLDLQDLGHVVLIVAGVAEDVRHVVVFGVPFDVELEE